MKKIIKTCFFLCLTLSIMSCSLDIDLNNSGKSSIINPPNWIKGSWVNTDMDLGLQFTNDNLYSGNADFTYESCEDFKKEISESTVTNNSTFKEKITNSEYKYSYSATIDFDDDGEADTTMLIQITFTKLSTKTLKQKTFINGIKITEIDFTSTDLEFSPN